MEYTPHMHTIIEYTLCGHPLSPDSKHSMNQKFLLQFVLADIKIEPYLKDF